MDVSRDKSEILNLRKLIQTIGGLKNFSEIC